MAIGRIFCFLLATSFVAVPSFAKEPTFPIMPPGFKAGMEVELTEEHLAKLMPFFNFRALQTNRMAKPRLDETFFDNYLRDNPNALNSLPVGLKTRLTQGLVLESLVQKEQAPAIQIPAQKLEVAKPSFRLILPNEEITAPRPAIILPDAPKPVERIGNFRETKGLIKPTRLDWEILYDRWKKIPFSEKEKVVDWELLAPEAKAVIAKEVVGSFASDAPLLTLHADAPELMQKLEWHRDLDAIEFRHRIALDNAEALYRDIVGFGKLAGVSSKLENAPESRLTGVSLHYHLSIPGRNLRQILEGLNELWLLKRLDQGIISDLTDDGEFNFKQDLNYRGLFRLVSEDRFEVRAHPEKLAQELPFVLEILSLPEEQELVKLKEARAALLQKEDVTNLFLKYSSDLLLDWKDDLPPEVIAEASNFEKVLLRGLQSNDPVVKKAALRRAITMKNVPSEIGAHTASFFSREATSTPEGMTMAYQLAEKFLSLENCPAPVLDQIVELLPNMKEHQVIGMVDYILYYPRPESFWPKLFEFFSREDLSERIKSDAKIFLRVRKFPPSFLARALAANLPEDFHETISKVVVRNYSAAGWTKPQQDSAHLMLRALSDEHLSAFLFGLIQQDSIPPTVLPELAALSRRKDLNPALTASLQEIFRKFPGASAQIALAVEPAPAGSGEQKKGFISKCKKFFSQLGH